MMMKTKPVLQKTKEFVLGVALVCFVMMHPYSSAYAFTNDRGDAFDAVVAIVVQFIVGAGEGVGKIMEEMNRQDRSEIAQNGNKGSPVISGMLLPLIKYVWEKHKKQWNEIVKIINANRHCFPAMGQKALKHNSMLKNSKLAPEYLKKCIADVMKKVGGILEKTDLMKWLKTQLDNTELRYTLYDTACKSFILTDLKKSAICKNSILVVGIRPSAPGTGVGQGPVSKRICVVQKTKSDKTTPQQCVDSVYQTIRNNFPMTWREKCEAQIEAYTSMGREDLAKLLTDKCFPPAQGGEVDQGVLIFTDTETAQSWGSNAFASWRINPEEKKAIRDYTASEYGPWNRCLRKNDCTTEDKKKIALINDALNRAIMPNNVVVHRTGDYAILNEQSAAAQKDAQSIVREQFTTPGLMSTGLVGGRNGVTTGSNVLVEIVLTIPRGTRGCSYVGAISDKPDEAEVLCSSGKKAFITKVEKVKGRLVVYANLL